MALAIHHGGPADGAQLRVPGVPPQTRYHLAAARRVREEWLELARYVFVPPRDGAKAVYQYTGIHQTRGPVPGGAAHPDWS